VKCILITITTGIAISNSPSGLAGYILEKFVAGTNFNWLSKHDGGILTHYSIDELLDNLMMYWVTNSFPTAIRLYAEAFTKYEKSLNMDR
jgi:juvenile hormone epoxide hydrolase